MKLALALGVIVLVVAGCGGEPPSTPIASTPSVSEAQAKPLASEPADETLGQVLLNELTSPYLGLQIDDPAAARRKARSVADRLEAAAAGTSPDCRRTLGRTAAAIRRGAARARVLDEFAPAYADCA